VIDTVKEFGQVARSRWGLFEESREGTPQGLSNLACLDELDRELDQADDDHHRQGRHGESSVSLKGPWRLSFSEVSHRGFTKARFRRLGLPPNGKTGDA
jgi:hypothetical protein